MSWKNKMFLYYISKIIKGQSIARIMMNNDLRNYSISGKTLDIGGGRRPDYFKYL
jgi:hypothetical protein